jgi:hypothetical protein
VRINGRLKVGAVDAAFARMHGIFTTLRDHYWLVFFDHGYLISQTLE